jgi:uncharacterized membrane protein
MQNMSGGKTALGLDTNVGALLVYMPVCAISLIYSIIVLVTEKNDRFMRFHAFQSLLITALYIVALIAVSILGSMIGIITGSSILASLFSLLMFVVIIIFLAAMIYGCIKGYQGQKFKFPLVGDMAEKWAG